MIEMFKLTHGLYDTQAVEDFLDLKPSRARGHKYNEDLPTFENCLV